MHYKSYVRLVDTHTECYGSDNNIDLFHKELILALRP